MMYSWSPLGLSTPSPSTAMNCSSLLSRRVDRVLCCCWLVRPQSFWHFFFCGGPSNSCPQTTQFFSDTTARYLPRHHRIHPHSMRRCNPHSCQSRSPLVSVAASSWLCPCEAGRC